MAVALNASASLYSAQLRGTSAAVPAEQNGEAAASPASVSRRSQRIASLSPSKFTAKLLSSTRPGPTPHSPALYVPVQPHYSGSDSESSASTLPASPTRSRSRPASLPFREISLNLDHAPKATDLLAQPPRPHSNLPTTGTKDAPLPPTAIHSVGITPAIKGVHLSAPPPSSPPPLLPVLAGYDTLTPLRRMDAVLTPSELAEIAKDTPLGSFIHKASAHAALPIHRANHTNHTNLPLHIHHTQHTHHAPPTLSTLSTRPTNPAPNNPPQGAPSVATQPPQSTTAHTQPKPHATMAGASAKTEAPAAAPATTDQPSTPKVIRVLRSRAIVDSPLASPRKQTTALAPLNHANHAAGTFKATPSNLLHRPTSLAQQLRLFCLRHALTIALSAIIAFLFCSTVLFQHAPVPVLLDTPLPLETRPSPIPLETPPSSSPSHPQHHDIDEQLVALEARLARQHSQLEASASTHYDTITDAIARLRAELLAANDASHHQLKSTLTAQMDRAFALLQSRVSSIEARIDELAITHAQPLAQTPSPEVHNPTEQKPDLTTGALIIHALTSSPYKRSKRTADAALSNDLAPGSCFAFSGNRGKLAIQLQHPVPAAALSHVAIQHPTAPDQVPSRLTAPRDWELWAFADDKSELSRPRLLARGSFDRNGPATQLFPVLPASTHPDDAVLRVLQLRIRNNHGHPDYTCLYRFNLY